MLKKLPKLLALAASADFRWYRSLLLYRVAATTEHTRVIRAVAPDTVVDIGANRGQFSLAALHERPNARLFCFEPLAEPRSTLEKVLGSSDRIRIFPLAIGNQEEERDFYVSSRDDSSSLLPISENQTHFFPGTGLSHTESVQVAALDQCISSDELDDNSMLKIDVQGFELQVLEGAESLLPRFANIYVECSFVELYEGQSTAHEVTRYLSDRGFEMKGVYNTHYDSAGIAVQADFLFTRTG